MRWSSNGEQGIMQDVGGERMKYQELTSRYHGIKVASALYQRRGSHKEQQENVSLTTLATNYVILSTHIIYSPLQTRETNN